MAVGVAVGVGLSSMAIAFSIVAVPVFALANLDGNGLDRPSIRTALAVAVILGVVAGLTVGAIVGVWYGRGGRLPNDRTPFHEDQHRAEWSD